MPLRSLEGRFTSDGGADEESKWDAEVMTEASMTGVTIGAPANGH